MARAGNADKRKHLKPTINKHPLSAQKQNKWIRKSTKKNTITWSCYLQSFQSYSRPLFQNITYISTYFTNLPSPFESLFTNIPNITALTALSGPRRPRRSTDVHTGHKTTSPGPGQSISLCPIASMVIILDTWIPRWIDENVHFSVLSSHSGSPFTPYPAK